MNTSRNRTPGRPRADAGTEARDRLLRTAAELFAAHGFEGTSLKQVAVGADVTPAMVAYYFRDKAGLLEEVVLDGLGHVLDAVQAVADDPEEQEPFVARLIKAWLRVINTHPWIPLIMVREVISRDTPLRDLVKRRFMARAVQIVPPRVARDIQQGWLRDDLDPVHTVLSILGMCVFPYIAEPLLGPMLGFRIDAAFGERYAMHTTNLVLSGAGARS